MLGYRLKYFLHFITINYKQLHVLENGGNVYSPNTRYNGPCWPPKLDQRLALNIGPYCTAAYSHELDCKIKYTSILELSIQPFFKSHLRKY